MADISKLSRLVGGVQRQVDLSSNALVVGSLKVNATELTETILVRLISLQNGSDVDATYHTHDGRYFTETELGSATASSGSDLIGDDNTYSNFTPIAATVKGALAGIDSALANAGSDENVKVSANDATAGYLEAKIVVDNGANATDPLEASTLNDGGDEDFRIRFDQSKVDHGSLAGLSDDDHTQYILVDGTRAFTGDQSVGGFKLTSLANGTLSSDAVNKGQLDAVQSLIENFEWQESALDYITDNTVAPPTEVSGDRYVLSHGGGTPHADWDGASAGDIVEYDGTSWVAVTPTLGTFIAIDNEPNVLYYWGGSAWSTKAFESTTASNGLEKVGFDIRIAASAAGAGLAFTAGTLSVNADDSTIEVDVDTLRVKNAGITETELAASVAGDGLSGGAGSALSVNVDDSTIEIATDTLQVKDGGITDAKVAAGSSLAESVVFFDATDMSGAEAEQLTDGSNADSLHAHALVKKVVTVGEAIAANTSFLVRWAVNGETAGRVYKADNDASSADNFYAVGIISGGAGLSAGDTATMTMLGSYSLDSSDTTFNAADIGKPVYLGSSGAFTVTAPSANNTAVYRVGIVENTDKIFLGNMQINGVN